LTTALFLALLAALAPDAGTPTALPAAPAAPAAAAPADQDAPTVAARVEKNTAHVGDALPFTITTVGPKAMPVVLPATLDLGPFTELARTLGETDLGDGRMRREFALKIAAYEPGEKTVPAVALTYFSKDGQVRSAHTEPVAITIESLLANEPEPKLKDNSESVAVIERDMRPIYAGIVLGAALLGAGIALLIRRRLRHRKPAAPAAPPRPAHEIALEKLDRLTATLSAGGDLRPFYFELSETIREYLGGRFRFNALEMTTEELVAALPRHLHPADLRGMALSEIEGWLSLSDLVKFAKISPTELEARGAMETALRLVKATLPLPPVSEVPHA
jgi:hypothetical protein